MAIGGKPTHNNKPPWHAHQQHLHNSINARKIFTIKGKANKNVYKHTSSTKSKIICVLVICVIHSIITTFVICLVQIIIK